LGLYDGLFFLFSIRSGANADDDESDDEMSTDDEVSKQGIALETTVLCNAALAFIKQNKWIEAIENASGALKNDPVSFNLLLPPLRQVVAYGIHLCWHERCWL